MNFNKKLSELLEVGEYSTVQPSYIIYCDLDGVLTDFESRFEQFTGTHPKAYIDRYGETPFWDLIDNRIGIRFWSKMSWMPEGRVLWSIIEPFGAKILTSPSKHETSRLGKNLWVRENIQPQPQVLFAYSEDKCRYADENSILIDDKDSNILQWEQAGGIGMRCVNGNITPILDSLKALGYKF